MNDEGSISVSEDNPGGRGTGGSPSRHRFLWPAVAAVLALITAVLVGYILGTRGDNSSSPVAAPVTTTRPSTATATPTTVAQSLTTPSVVTPAPAPPVTVSCGVNLTAAAVADAVAGLPPEPLTSRPFGLGDVRGNYDPCATLSTALVFIQGATGGSPVQALMFHKGQYLATATSKAYGFTSLNAALTTDTTVVMDYKTPGSCNACSDSTVTTVRYRWDGTQVQMLDSLPSSSRTTTTPRPTSTEPACRGVNCPAPGAVGNVGGPRSRGIPFVSCPRDQQSGTGLYANGQLDYAPECLPGGSGGR